MGVHLQFQKAKGDPRPEAEILAEGRAGMLAVRERGVFLAHGHGPDPADLEPALAREIHGLYADAKRSVWAELAPAFLESLPELLLLRTRSRDREDYLLHPETGEQLLEAARAELARERERHGGRFDVQLVVSDGLNAQAISDPGHLAPCLAALTTGLATAGYRVAPTPILILAGRVRAGYQVGEQLFGGLAGPRVLLHLIGERPGSGHHTFSIYLTKAEGLLWGTPGRIDHSLTRVVSGLALTARDPVQGARDALRILEAITARSGS